MRAGKRFYATAKGGVDTLTKAMAKELVSDGILVNVVAPGRIATQDILLGREGTPEEVVGTILFLSSSYSDYVVGEIIEVTGGIF